jgi:glycosyltransferase involved in cell wall biosynthesis
MPRILHVMADGAVGGGSVHVLQILRGLADGKSFGVVTQPDSFLARESEAAGADVSGADLYPSTRLRSIRRLPAIVRAFAPDLVHVHGGRGAFALAAAGVSFDLYTVHGYHFQHRGGFRARIARSAERFAAARSRRVVFVSTHDAELARRLRLIPERVSGSVIHNGIRCDAAAGERPAKKHIGFLGRFVEQKDPILFVEALARLPGYRATMIGDGDLRDAVVAAIERHGVGDRVLLPGALDNDHARAELRSFGALVMTSRWEPMGIVPLEAFCAGVPVVAPEVGGIPEVVEHERSGLIVSRTADAIAAAVKRLEIDDALRHLLVANGRERVRTTFSEVRMLREIARLYDSLLPPGMRAP